MNGCMDEWGDWNDKVASFGEINACGGELFNPLPVSCLYPSSENGTCCNVSCFLKK